MDSNESAIDTVERYKHLNIDSRHVIVQMADSGKNFEQAAKASTVIFIKKLPKEATEEDIQDYFKDYNIKQLHLVKDKFTGKSKCFGYIEFNDLFNFKKALALEKGILHGKEFEILKSERPITANMDE